MAKNQKQVQAPKLNNKHRVVIRLGAMHDSITLNGHVTDLSRRDDESFKDNLGRRQRTINDLNAMIFS